MERQAVGEDRVETSLDQHDEIRPQRYALLYARGWSHGSRRAGSRRCILCVQSSRSISTSAFSSRRMMKLRQKIFGGFGLNRAGVDPAERVAAGDLGRRGTIR